MKVFIATDLEGVCGVYSFQQTRDGHGSAPNLGALRLQREEVNAAVRGAFAGGATQVVADGLHGHGGPLDLGSFDERLEMILGGHNQVESVWQAIAEAQFDAVFLLGYHARANTPGGVLCHTQSSKALNNVWINGRLVGEAEQSAIAFGAMGAPVVLVTGDDHTCREAREFLGDQPVTVEVKRGLARQCAWSPAPKRAWQLIEDGAREAMGRVAEAKPYEQEFPVTIRWQFLDSGALDRFSGKGARIDSQILEKTVHRPQDILWP